MTERKYNLGAMGDFISFLSKQESTLKDAAQQAQKTADGILSHYTGKGADAFRQTHQQWQQTFAKHIDSLETLRQRVTAARDNYQNAEATNRQMRS
ncbi:WXG100 family type VII secretion target [Mycobacteroides abscessus]|uniref:WXG100 family type VII secretion target n=1 Tax=Mycobacteroides abscessus TaxID=36809 RepID=UPI00092A6D4E|nr:WXG100 family type VII secretion target [Mycobacteroides abscessus]MDO3331874.1 WXG100 family type VII secretion target [Mycobacteroides abscessus subsp. bolletii]QSM88832.1 WXG100 family type VII secretion target [Mycobacteroides abscessus subsp. bolletii]UEA48120.1 WXG100 family type VII secretion target [Mycobacteroides abscessus subsp. abscessus]UEA51900.1 WXG100 family type VII secretion target [Mycobacteroides abscessus]SHS49055.1 WXG100 family type VII secretion target [Mycobacteroid